MIDKKVRLEILIIIVISIILAIIYNAFNPSGISFLPKKTVIVTDSLLFSNVPTIQSIDTLPSVNKIPQAKDTFVVEKKDSLIKTSTESKVNAIELESKINHDFKTVTFEQMKRIIESTNFIIIDARQPAEYEKAHIPKSINIFPYEEEATLIPKVFSLPKDKTIIVYCDGGTCDLSHHLAEKLINSFGFKRVFLYEGGWEEWSTKFKD